MKALRRALYIALSVAALGAAALCAFTGCTNSSAATIYTPITGIVIHSSDLVAGGATRGCGTGPDQVYAYVAVLAHAASPSIPYTSIVVPCYVDGVLSNLQPFVFVTDAGQTFDLFDYKLYIYAYNAQSFPPSLACAPPQPTGNCPGDFPDAATRAAAVDGGDIPPLYPPNWTTTCTAIEIAGIPELADCQPLEPAPAAVTVGTQSFPTADGGTLRCDAGDYTTVMASWNVGDAAGADAASGGEAVTCPAPIAIAPALPNAHYTINLDLERPLDGGPTSTVANVTCSATATPGVDAGASCAPAAKAP